MRSVWRNALDWTLRLTGRRSDPVQDLAPVPPVDQDSPATARIVSSGVVVRDFEVSDQYPGAALRTVPMIPLTRGGTSRETVLNVFEAQEVAVTTIYLPIDVKTGRLFINQTYEGVLHFWGPRAEIADGRYRFHAEAAEVITRKAAIIGGPIDGNYYHWMLNWLSRVATLKMLSPELYSNPDVALLVDWRAKTSPFIEFLHAIGFGEDRLIWVDHTRDYLLKEAVLVSFGAQHLIAPTVVGAMREMFSPLGKQAKPATRPRRLWISRQQLGPNRRRIHNMDEVKPVLDAYGLEEVILEGLPIAEQIALFQSAEFIASVHGAGLTNIIFSPPDCRVLALDSSVHVRFGAAIIYDALAEACGITYRSLRTGRARRPADVERTVPNMHNQDLLVSATKLDTILHEMLGSRVAAPPAAD